MSPNPTPLTRAQLDTILAAPTATDIMVRLWGAVLAANGRQWPADGETVVPGDYGIHHDDWLLIADRVAEIGGPGALMDWISTSPAAVRED